MWIRASKGPLSKNIFLLVCWVFGYQIGDEICDGIANNEACNYDDGDCCLTEINKICYGDDCICHEDGLVHPEVFCNWNPFNRKGKTLNN